MAWRLPVSQRKVFLSVLAVRHSTLKRGRLQGSGVSGVGFSKQRPGGRGGRGGRGRWPAHTPPAGVPRSVSDLLGLSF